MLSSDNGEIGSRSHPYQPEAFQPSGPGWFCFGTGQQFFFVLLLLCSTSIPSFTQYTADPGQPKPNANDLENCCCSAPYRVPCSVSSPAPVCSRAAIDGKAAARLCLCWRGQCALKKAALSSGYSKQSLQPARSRHSIPRVCGRSRDNVSWRALRGASPRGSQTESGSIHGRNMSVESFGTAQQPYLLAARAVGAGAASTAP